MIVLVPLHQSYMRKIKHKLRTTCSHEYKGQVVKVIGTLYYSIPMYIIEDSQGHGHVAAQSCFSRRALLYNSGVNEL